MRKSKEEYSQKNSLEFYYNAEERKKTKKRQTKTELRRLFNKRKSSKEFDFKRNSKLFIILSLFFFIFLFCNALFFQK